MATKVKRKKPAQVKRSGQDVLLGEMSEAVDQALKAHNSGKLTQDQFLTAMSSIEGRAGVLDDVAKARLGLRLDSAMNIASSQVAPGRAATMVPRIQAAVQKVSGGGTSPELQAVLGRLDAAQHPRAAVRRGREAIKIARGVARNAEAQATIPRIEQAVGKVRIPTLNPMGPGMVATANPEVQAAVARLKGATTPRQVTQGGREVFRVARGAQKAAAGKPVVGKGLMAAGGVALLGMIASKAFGKNEVDPQMQLMLAQRLGQAQEGGADSSRQLMDLSRALTVVKKLQELAAVQGPAAARPRLI